MGSLTTPLNSLLRFGRSFRAAKRGQAVRQLTEVPGPVIERDFAVNPLYRFGEHRAPLGMRINPAWEKARKNAVKWTATSKQKAEFERLTPYLPIKPREIPLSPAQHYGEILGKGLRKPSTQLNLFTKVNPETLDKARRTQAVRQLKKTVMSDIAAVKGKASQAVRRWGSDFSIGRHGGIGPIMQGRGSALPFRVGRVARAVTHPHETLRSIWGTGYAGGSPHTPALERFRRGINYGRTHGAYPGSRGPFRAGIAIGRAINTPIREPMQKLAQEVGASYDRAAARVNHVAARYGFGKNPKISLKAYGEPLHTGGWGEHAGHGVIQEYQIRANRVPIGAAGITATEYGRVARLDPIPLLSERRAPGYPQFSARPNAPLRERIRNLRQSFDLLRQQHPGVHDWTMAKAVPRSREVGELERMVGAEGAPTMRLRKLRYTRPPRG